MADPAAAILYLSGGARGLYCLRGLLDAKEPVVGVVGHPGTAGDEVARLAEGAGIPYRDPADPNHEKVLAWAGGLGCSLAVMAGYNRILRRAFLDLIPEGVINLHGGPLPEYRGGSPLNWQILRGEPEIGISILYTDEGIDTGPVLQRDCFALAPDETIDSVVQRSLPRFQKMLLEVLDGLRHGALVPEAQDESRARYFAKRLPRDGWIDWRTSTAQQAHDLIRALSGAYPGAFTFHGGHRIGIESSRRLEETIIAPPGRVLARRGGGVEVACADRALLITEVRAADGRVIPAREGLPRRGSTLDAWMPNDFDRSE